MKRKHEYTLIKKWRAYNPASPLHHTNNKDKTMEYKITVYLKVLEPWKGYEYTVFLQGLTTFLTKRAKVDKKEMVAWTPRLFKDTYRKSVN